jgi:hypothetical protein
MLRDRIFPTLTKERDLVEVAGGTFEYRVRLFRDKTKPHFLKAYKVMFLISRYGEREPVIQREGVFDPTEQNFKVTIPAHDTQKLSGNYIYHIKVITPSGWVVIKNYGHLFVHQLIKEKG